MQRASCLVIVGTLLFTGCRATGEALFEGVFDAVWDAGTDRILDSDDDQFSEEELRYKRAEEQWREFRED
ncbi:MAG TPA: hypothetical protein VF175_07170 [Lacipirellula sp.]